MTSCAVVVTYNRIDLLRVCLDALIEQSVPMDEIIVIDNGSTDGTRDLLTRVYGNRVTTVFSKNNGGGAGGFSQGVERALSSGHSKAWLMDDDAEPSKDAHEALCNAWSMLVSEGVTPAFLASSVVDENGQRISTHCPIATEEMHGLEVVPYASFVGVQVNLLKAANTYLPVADFFLYHDDVEYTSRIARDGLGFRVPDSCVQHPDKRGGGGIGARGYYDVRNRIWIRRDKRLADSKNRDRLNKRLMKRILHDGRSENNKATWGTATVRGVWAGFARRPTLVMPGTTKTQ